jgi:hypothetical protein
MRRAREDRHAASYQCLRHRRRNGKVRSPIIDPRQNVAMQVDHSVYVLTNPLKGVPQPVRTWSAQNISICNKFTALS